MNSNATTSATVSVLCGCQKAVPELIGNHGRGWYHLDGRYHDDHFPDSNCFAVATTMKRVVILQDGGKSEPSNHNKKMMAVPH